MMLKHGQDTGLDVDTWSQTVTLSVWFVLKTIPAYIHCCYYLSATSTEQHLKCPLRMYS